MKHDLTPGAMVPNNFQRVGALHNTGVGQSFEDIARSFFQKKGIKLQPNFSVRLGLSHRKKNHRFDLGSDNPPILVECKSHSAEHEIH
jgi:hypothetical protein